MSKNMTVKKMCFCAICIALAVIANMITIYKFPFGGSVTLFSMLIIVLPAWFYGIRTGVLCGLIYGIMQFVLEPYMISVIQVTLDYVLAFSVMGVAGIFHNDKNGLLKGYGAAIIARWIIATCAGLVWVQAGSVAWEGWAPLPYSAAYNAAYIFTEGIATLIILCTPQLKNALSHIKKQALSQ